MGMERSGAQARGMHPASPAEAELGWLIDRIPEVIARVSTAGEFRYVSAAARRLYGREPEELIGTNALDLLADPAGRAEATRRLEALAERRVPRPGSRSRWRRRRGRSRSISSAAAFATRSTGELEIVSVARAATERIETEEALAVVEARFRELLEWLPAVVYEAETGPHGACHYVSPQIEELLGYTPSEWVADRTLWLERIHDDDVDQVLERRARARARARARLESGEHGDRWRASTGCCTARGASSGFATSPGCRAGPDGSAFWRGVLTDITSERTAQLSLADAHERHRTMVEGLPACVYQAERRAMGRWHFVSSQIERLLGYTAAEWRADPTLWRASLHADDRERVEFDEQRHLSEPPGTELVSEYRIRHRTGRTVWVRDRAVLSENEHGERMIDGILTDISAERAAAAGAEGRADVYRLCCNECGETWPTTGIERCRACGSRNVEGTSLNSTLRDLAVSRQQVEGLLDGIQRHLEALGTNLRSGPAPLGPARDRPPARPLGLID